MSRQQNIEHAHRPDLTDAVMIGAECCTARDRDGWWCTLPEEHDGDHAAGLGNHIYVRTWSRTLTPEEVTCPACFAKPGEPCTTTTSTGRRPVKFLHHSREDEADRGR